MAFGLAWEGREDVAGVEELSLVVVFDRCAMRCDEEREFGEDFIELG